MSTDQLSRPTFGQRRLPTTFSPVRRKVFVSYSHLDQHEANEFVSVFAGNYKTFVPKMVGRRADLDKIDSTNTDYVMQRIRSDYMQDSTVTIVLVGTCTHSRRYIDWEIKASLQRGSDSLPNGIIAIQLRSAVSGAVLPDRLLRNWSSGHLRGYVRYWKYPQTSEVLRGWIEDAFNARTERAQQINNPQQIMLRNSSCRVHHFTH